MSFHHGIKRRRRGEDNRREKKQCTEANWEQFQEEVTTVGPMDLTLSNFRVTNYHGLQVMFHKIDAKKRRKQAWRNLAYKTIWEARHKKNSEPVDNNQFFDWIFKASNKLDQFTKKTPWAKDVLRLISKSKFSISKPQANIYGLVRSKQKMGLNFNTKLVPPIYKETYFVCLTTSNVPVAPDLEKQMAFLPGSILDLQSAQEMDLEGNIPVTTINIPPRWVNFIRLLYEYDHDRLTFLFWKK